MTLLSGRKADNVFYVTRLREEVKRLYGCDLIVVSEQVLEVTCLSSGIAGDVDNTVWSILCELVKESDIAALAWRVNNDSGFCRRNFDMLKDALCLP